MRRIDRLTAERAGTRFSTAGLSLVGLPTPAPTTPGPFTPAPTTPGPGAPIRTIPGPFTPTPTAPGPGAPIRTAPGPGAAAPTSGASVPVGPALGGLGRGDSTLVGSGAVDRGRGVALGGRHDSTIGGAVARGLVRSASERGAEGVLPVPGELRGLLPAGGLRRGATVAVRSMSVMLALLSAASRAGSWCGVVGLPALNPVAAAEMGIALDRLALVPHPGTEWTTAVAALLDGFDIVVAAPPGPIAPVVAGRLAARARQRGSVLMPAGAWAGADLTVEAVVSRWEGLGSGRGRLRGRQLTIRAHGRGAASAPRQVTVWLPAFDRHGFGRAAPYTPEFVEVAPAVAEVAPLRRVG